jgi:hypothetical protein
MTERATELDPLPREIEDLLELERAAPGPSATQIERLDRRIRQLPDIVLDPSGPSSGGSSSGGASSSGASSGGASSSGASVAGASTLVRTLVLSGVFVLGGAVGSVITWRALSSSETGATVSTESPAVLDMARERRESGVVPRDDGEVPGVLEPAVLAAAADPAPESPRPRAEPTSTANSAGRDRGNGDDALGRDLVLLERARVALGRGQYPAALAAVNEHAERFASHGVEEREAIAIQAHAGLGDHQTAERRSARFLARHPNSFFRPTIEATLRQMRPSAEPAPNSP